MAESSFSLEEQLVLALLYLEGPRTPDYVARHFQGEAYAGPDAVPVDLTSAWTVGELLEAMSLREDPVVKPVRGGLFGLRDDAYALMRLAGRAARGGVLGVLHD